MAEYDSAWCLAEFRNVAELPDDTVSPDNAAIYGYVTKACRRIQRLLAAHVPDAVCLPPEQLLSVNDGVTYTFAYFPYGHLEIRDGRDGPVLLPGTDWDASHDTYLLTGQTLRWPDNTSRTFADGLWARYVPEIPTIDEDNDPILVSVAMQAAIYDAVGDWALRGGAMNPAPYHALRQRELWGDPMTPGDTGIVQALKTQQFGQGTMASGGGSSGIWWRGNGWI